jgi:isoleucyl-tRNA synthetase
MVVRLSQLLSPILAFTADEAWEFIPGHSKGDSVHASDWSPVSFALSPEEKTKWDLFFAWRNQILTELEKMRQEKTIGKALEAKVHLKLSPETISLNDRDLDALRELLNVSQLTVEKDASLAENTRSIQIVHAEGQKCERCWHWELTVGANTEHPTLCARCVDALKPLV